MSKRKEHIHYLKALLENGSVYQFEVREALKYALGKLGIQSRSKDNGGARMRRGKVFAIIKGERDYQEAQFLEGGRFQTQVHSVGEELVLMQEYLNRAFKAYTDKMGDAPALHAIRKVTALGVRCMENHGALPRETGSFPPFNIQKPKEKEEK